MRKGSHLFDVTIEVCGRAEVNELVDASLLYQLPQKFDKKDITLYRVDGLAVFKNIS